MRQEKQSSESPGAHPPLATAVPEADRRGRMESSLSSALAEPALSPGAAVALAWEGGQGSPFPASSEDGRRQLLPAQHLPLPFPSLHTLAQESEETSLAEESMEASDRS